MKLAAGFLSILTVVGVVYAQQGPPLSPPTPDAAVWVQYINGVSKVYKFGECIPLAIPPGHIPVRQALTLQGVDCFAEQGSACQDGTAFVVGVDLPPRAPLPNIANIAEDVAQGARCFKNNL